MYSLRVISSDSARSPNSSRTRASLPHRIGGSAPGGGAGAKVAKSPEELGRQAVGREVDHPDRASRAADTQELVGDLLVVGGEHRAERGGDDVELALAEGQRLGVRLNPLALDLRARASRRPASKFSGLGPRPPPAPRPRRRGWPRCPFPRPRRARAEPLQIPQAATSTGPSPQTVCFANALIVAERPHRPLGSLVLLIGPSVADAPSVAICISYLLDPCERCRPQQVSWARSNPPCRPP